MGYHYPHFPGEKIAAWQGLGDLPGSLFGKQQWLQLHWVVQQTKARASAEPL